MRIISVMIAAMMIICLPTLSFASNTVNDNEKINSGLLENEIDTVLEFEDEIEKYANEGMAPSQIYEEVIDTVDEDVFEEYIESVDEHAFEYFNEAVPDEEKYNAENDETIMIYRREIDPMTSVELVLTDCEEKSNISKIRSLFIEDSYAAQNGDVLWKKYGKRYYTAKYTRWIGPGWMKFASENHYTLSESKIKERYADTWIDTAVSIDANMISTGYSLRSAATREGKTTGIKVRSTVKVSYVVEGNEANITSTYYEMLKIKFVKDNPKEKKMKVKYTWNKTS